MLHSLPPRITIAPTLRRGNGSLFFVHHHLKRNSGHHLLVDDHVDGVKASLLEFDLLQVKMRFRE
jgi:hypothetical protein